MPTNKPASAEESAAAANADPKTSEPFVERMFSGLLHATVPHTPLQPALEEPYRPLREVKAHAGVTYRLQNQTRELHVQASSPATDVMTDLSRVIAVTTTANATVDEAHLAMIKRGVRALFVLGESRVVVGIITANDILGERPVQIAHLGGSGPGFNDPKADAFMDALIEELHGNGGSSSIQNPKAKIQNAKNLWFDVASVAHSTNTPERTALLLKRIRQIGVKRILYGTDLALGGNLPPRESWAEFAKIGLTPDELKTIAKNRAPYFR